MDTIPLHPRVPLHAICLGQWWAHRKALTSIAILPRNGIAGLRICILEKLIEIANFILNFDYKFVGLIIEHIKISENRQVHESKNLP